MMFVPITSHFKKPQIQSVSCTCRRLNLSFYILALFLGLLVMMVFLGNMKEIFTEFHLESDTDGELVKLPQDYAEEFGALCLDGSPPAFYIRYGQMEGRKNWIIYLPSGSWCYKLEDCYHKSQTSLGSTVEVPSVLLFQGLMSRDPSQNPNFYNWNIVQFQYCDGGSFLGNRSKPLKFNSKLLYFRGARIFSTLINFLMKYSDFDNAEEIVLAGSSAGGIAALVHSDHLRKQLTRVTSVRAIVDSALFVDTESISGDRKMKDILSSTFDLHHIKNTDAIQECTQKPIVGDGWKCLMPSVFYKYLFTPVFFVNSLHDTWVMKNALGILDTASLGSSEFQILLNVKNAIFEIVRKINVSHHDGVLISPCPFHSTLTNTFQFNELALNMSYLHTAIFEWYSGVPYVSSKYISDLPFLNATDSEQCYII